MLSHLEAYHLAAIYAWYYQRGRHGGHRLHDLCPYMFPLWQRVGQEVRGPRWAMDFFLAEFMRFWSGVVERVEEGRN